MSPRNVKQNEQMRQESLKKITDAALGVFAEFGYHGATLKKITNAADLSYGLVYHYFPSKEKIFLHLVDIAFTYSRSIMTGVMDGSGSAWEKIRAFSAILARELSRKELAYYFIITQQAMTQARDIPGIVDFVTSRSDHYQHFEELIIEGQRTGDVVDGDPELLSAAYLALFQGMAMMVQHQDDLKNRVTPEIFNSLLTKKH